MKHSHTVSLHSFQVFLSFLFIENLLQFSHWFLISNMAFNMSYTLCFPPTLNFATVHFTVNFSFSLASDILQLSKLKNYPFSLEDLAKTVEKIKNLWIFYHEWYHCPFLLEVYVLPHVWLCCLGYNRVRFWFLYCVCAFDYLHLKKLLPTVRWHSFLRPQTFQSPNISILQS